ncbi:hypothetical protein HD806DRAFT_531779 [Xylariaceae sp. AK1471]|nr:hypothetical protein HD806DRAFT_531779 [Xylariaceae sp. AK1471]
MAPTTGSREAEPELGKFQGLLRGPGRDAFLRLANAGLVREVLRQSKVSRRTNKAPETPAKRSSNNAVAGQKRKKPWKIVKPPLKRPRIEEKEPVAVRKPEPIVISDDDGSDKEYEADQSEDEEPPRYSHSNKGPGRASAKTVLDEQHSQQPVRQSARIRGVPASNDKLPETRPKKSTRLPVDREARQVSPKPKITIGAHQQSPITVVAPSQLMKANSVRVEIVDTASNAREAEPTTDTAPEETNSHEDEVPDMVMNDFQNDLAALGEINSNIDEVADIDTNYFQNAPVAPMGGEELTLMPKPTDNVRQQRPTNVVPFDLPKKDNSVREEKGLASNASGIFIDRQKNGVYVWTESLNTSLAAENTQQEPVTAPPAAELPVEVTEEADSETGQTSAGPFVEEAAKILQSLYLQPSLVTPRQTPPQHQLQQETKHEVTSQRQPFTFRGAQEPALLPATQAPVEPEDSNDCFITAVREVRRPRENTRQPSRAAPIQAPARIPLPSFSVFRQFASLPPPPRQHGRRLDDAPVFNISATLHRAQIPSTSNNFSQSRRQRQQAPTAIPSRQQALARPRVQLSSFRELAPSASMTAPRNPPSAASGTTSSKAHHIIQRRVAVQRASFPNGLPTRVPHGYRR